MAATYILKRGDSFAPACQVQDGTTPRSIVGWTIASQVREQTGRLVATLTAGGRSDSAGTYSLSADTNTATWPVGPLYWDIQYTDSAGTVFSTETIQLLVVEDITR